MRDQTSKERSGIGIVPADAGGAVERAGSGPGRLRAAFLAAFLAAVTSVYGQAAGEKAAPPPAPAPESDWLTRTIGEEFPKAITDGKFNLNARLRWEHADQEGLKASDAFTIRTRFGFTTAPVHKFQAMIEGENTKIIGPNVNYAAPGNNAPGHTAIADPELTEVNRAWVSYSNWDTSVKAGRQRIIHDGARFIGNVGWRQAEQTYDAVTLVNKSIDDTMLSYGYLANVERVNDTSLNSDSHIFNGSYSGLKFGKLTAYAYLLEFPNDSAALANLSSHTFGASFAGSQPVAEDWKISYLGEFAWQTEGRESNLEYQAEYYHVNGGAGYKQFDLSAGYEVLGTDNGVGFFTPLATLAKWNGWADVFAGGTPGQGLRDIYVSGAVKLPYGVPIVATYHHFTTDYGGVELGDEIDVTVTKQFGKNWSVLAQYAHFEGTSVGPADRDKFWLQLEFNY